jgi:hypothetical protein
MTTAQMYLMRAWCKFALILKIKKKKKRKKKKKSNEMMKN